MFVINHIVIIANLGLNPDWKGRCFFSYLVSFGSLLYGIAELCTALVYDFTYSVSV